MIALSPLASAQTTSDVDALATTLDATAANQGTNPGQTRIAAFFTNLAGSKENALALVNALRNGTATATPRPAQVPAPATAPARNGTGPTTTDDLRSAHGQDGLGQREDFARACTRCAAACRHHETDRRATAGRAERRRRDRDQRGRHHDHHDAEGRAADARRRHGLGADRACGRHQRRTRGERLKMSHAKVAALPTTTSPVVSTSTSPAVAPPRASPRHKGIVTAAGVSALAHAEPRSGQPAAARRGMVTAAGGGASPGAASATHGHGRSRHRYRRCGDQRDHRAGCRWGQRQRKRQGQRQRQGGGG